MNATCSNCQGTGRNPGSDEFDCTQCKAAGERNQLGDFISKHMQKDPSGIDVDWAVHQRAYAMGVAAMQEELAKANKVKDAVATLIKCKGRYHSEHNYAALVEVYNAAMKVAG